MGACFIFFVVSCVDEKNKDGIYLLFAITNTMFDMWMVDPSIVDVLMVDPLMVDPDMTSHCDWSM